MTAQAWSRLFAPQLKWTSTDMYELSDILRESLDSPIPNEPHTGWCPRSEHNHAVPLGSLDRRIHDVHADLEDYHADDELSELCSTNKKGTDRPLINLSAREDRDGATQCLTPDASHISSLSYYYYCYIDPDHTPKSPTESVCEENKKRVLETSEHESVSEMDRLLRAIDWRREVVIPTSVFGLQNTDALDAEEPEGSSVYQRLHDQAVESSDSRMAIEVWQGRTAVGSLDSPMLPPPSFLEHFTVPRHLSNADSCEPPLTVDRNDGQCDTESPSVRPMKQTLLPEELLAIRPVTDVAFSEHELPQARIQDDAIVDLVSFEYRPAAAKNVDCSTQQPPGKDLADLGEYHAAFRKIHGNKTSLSTYTPQKVQRMISILNKRACTVGQLKSFWDSRS